MKTLEKTQIINKTEFSYRDEDFFISKIEETIERIEKYSNFLGYRGEEDINFDKNLFSEKFKNFSTKGKKRLRNKLIRVHIRPSMFTINKFLHYLFARVLELKAPKIQVSTIEREIQVSRKKWIKARDEADDALLRYKEMKGNFYKEKDLKLPIAKKL